jgi:hypothetical protein
LVCSAKPCFAHFVYWSARHCFSDFFDIELVSMRLASSSSIDLAGNVDRCLDGVGRCLEKHVEMADWWILAAAVEGLGRRRPDAGL